MLGEYILFLAKIATLVIAIIVLLTVIIAIASKGKEKTKEKLQIKNLNEKFKTMARTLQAKILSKHAFKRWLKQEKKTAKELEHQRQELKAERRKIFVINFHGDIRAAAVKSLREEITAILTIAQPKDEVLLRLESAGGMVHAYGLAASQLKRLRNQHIPLTISIDKMAASGGYMMACVGNQVIAAPFAVIGSIGVIAQLPNFHRLLKKNEIEFEQVMAGEYKRTLTLFGENTKKGRLKLQEEVEETQQLFKNFIQDNRSQVNIDQVATGEHWYGSRAIKLKLVDDLITSDDYLLTASKNADIFEVSYIIKKGIMSKFATGVQAVVENLYNIILRKPTNITHEI